MGKKYSGIKSSVKKSTSAAVKSARSRLAAQGAARKGKYIGMKSSVSSNKTPTKKKRIPVRVMPMKGNHLVEQLPETELTRKGQTLKQLFAKTPTLMKENGTEVKLKNVKRLKTKTGKPALQAVAIHKDPYKPNATERPHTCMIIGLDQDKKITANGQKVVVSCDCENYVYMWEYANAKHGASQLIYSNGERPGFTNPGEVAGMCKHLVGLYDYAKRKGL